ncbi:transthyretin domain-containing protein [Stemphylium lycopersici]|uniref:hydroxyisourate hydrolase n=1 Tax=Stemphylium lycopersici TaxID=183478 RepID=A0A364N9I6_STELY|nr:transthyretin domain-containing protein [Stemphylium lycopersici]RAR13942.1 Hydroxyisourate hydrolase [Stemphylium lycopersici]
MAHDSYTPAPTPPAEGNQRMQNSATTRIQALTSHLSPSPIPPATTASNPTMASETPQKPPITCHVLDTTLGRPAANIPVTLTLHSPTSSSAHPTTFTATTNTDGRVTAWNPSTPFSSTPLRDMFLQQGDQKYSLTFDTEAYFGERGIKTFFPEVEVKFLVREEGKGEHYHVPVLLGPFGYTTYRGS